ncbi:MAG: hypothetical protein ACR2RD_10325 [Woeseiaceae bacterium]
MDTRNSPAVLAAAILIMAGNLWAQESHEEPSGMRWEMWLAATYWPAFGDLQPLEGGSFDSYGFGLGGSALWPIAETENTELLLGAELAVLVHGSDVPTFLEEVVGTDGYLALSTKWMLGNKRSVSLDAGYAYHWIDISQVDYDYFNYDSDDVEIWDDGASGPFVGFTWDTWAGREGKNGGLALAFRVHFVDFDTVRDEDINVLPVLGPDAGTLDGPIYLLQIGYSSR